MQLNAGFEGVDKKTVELVSGVGVGSVDSGVESVKLCIGVGERDVEIVPDNGTECVDSGVESVGL